MKDNDSQLELSIFNDLRSLMTPPTLNKTEESKITMFEPKKMDVLENNFNIYVKQLSDVSQQNNDELKASFDNYLKTANNIIKDNSIQLTHGYHCPNLARSNLKVEDLKVKIELSKLEKSEIYMKEACKKYKIVFNNISTETQNKMIQGELKVDFMTYYQILDKIWAGTQLHKSEILQLQPCKILLLRSIIKRKFNEEISIT